MDTKFTISTFISKIFESREMAHVYHLQVNGTEGSAATHKALDKYYNDINPLLDDFIEIYQAKYGIIEGYNIIDTNFTRTNDEVAYFEGVVNFLVSGKQVIDPIDTHLYSIVDDIVNCLYKLIYKLKFLK